MEKLREPRLGVGAAGKAREGEAESGDRYLVRPSANGALLAIVDGLGHGAEAAHAASLAINVLADRPRDSVVELAQRCHEALRETRGVVLAIASLNLRGGILSWLCVGDVQCVLLRNDPNADPRYWSPVRRNGVVGVKLPPLLPATVSVVHGDTLILATDGIESGFTSRLPLAAAPQRIADHILEHHGKDTDDALVLVARYRGIE